MPGGSGFPKPRDPDKEAGNASTSRVSGARPLLSVERLRVEFPTRRGLLVAVDDVSFSLAPGEVLGVVGESGAGKSLTGAAIIGLIDPPGRIGAGQVLLDGRRIDNLPPEAMRRVRGREIGAVFQDPLTSLNPLYTIGQATRRDDHHAPRHVAGAGPATRAGPARGGRHLRAAAAHRPLSAPVLRRHAAARRDRAGARGETQAHHRRRADDGARCVDPGADHRAARRGCAATTARR